MPAELPTYTNGDNEQPTICPQCGRRTDWIDVSATEQIHLCLGCGYQFRLEFDEDEEPREEPDEGQDEDVPREDTGRYQSGYRIYRDGSTREDFRSDC